MREVIKTYIIVIIIAGMAVALSLFTFIPPCIFYGIIGIPCPACGLTRAFLQLFQFNIQGAFHYHPLFFLVPFIPLLMHEKIPLRIKTISSITLIILFFVAYIVRMILFFPHTAPMNINEDAILIQLIYLLRS